MDVKKIRHRPAATVGTVRESHQVDRRNWLAVVKVVQEFAPKSAEAEKIGDFWYALYVRPRFEKVEARPLEGLTGLVVRMKGVDRLIVSVSLLMRSLFVEIDRNHIKPLKRQLTAR